MTVRSLARKVDRLDRQWRARRRSAAGPPTPADWLALFRNLTSTMTERGEADWPDACQQYAEALETGNDQRINEARLWPVEMVDRSLTGIPPCTLAEWAELTAWFDAHLERLHQAAAVNWPASHIDIDGRQVLPGVIRNAIHMIPPYGGPKAFGSGTTAADIRRLRQMFSPTTDGPPAQSCAAGDGPQ